MKEITVVQSKAGISLYVDGERVKGPKPTLPNTTLIEWSSK
jgi:hypothetical protein